jgi:hypothetical protein
MAESRERRPGEGIFHFLNRWQHEQLLDALRPLSISEVMKRSLHELYWAPGAEIPRTADKNSRRVVEGGETSLEARDVRNGVEGAFYGYKGGRPRQWSSDSRYQKRMEDEIASRIDEGLSDREIADAVFGDRALYKRVQRFRRSRKPGS